MSQVSDEYVKLATHHRLRKRAHRLADENMMLRRALLDAPKPFRVGEDAVEWLKGYHEWYLAQRRVFRYKRVFEPKESDDVL